MADIAILVAEEYERRTKNLRKIGSEERGGINFNWVSSISAISQGIKDKVGQIQNMEAVKLILEPRSQISLAASNGFFSA